MSVLIDAETLERDARALLEEARRRRIRRAFAAGVALAGAVTGAVIASGTGAAGVFSATAVSPSP